MPERILVFGSNAQGFHGAGGAGLACRGDAANNWRNDAWFLAAMKAPPGSAARIGKRAIFGKARGFQRGKDGASYAIQTIERPGQRRSTSRREIYYQLVELVSFARSHPEYIFDITPLGEGYAGYTAAEMHEVWHYLQTRHGIPDNCCFTGHGVTPVAMT
jgi:hypothetical protein